MEENIALDSQKQKKFVKSIKGIKKLIKKNEDDNESKETNEQEQKPQKPFSMRLKGDKVGKRKQKERGLVYLGHIPHGFYEHQMTEYFKQFGVVTNVRVIRSKRTGNSKGYAFVEFKDTSVGEIVAETMNNYLMGKRLIKAAYIPPEKQKKAFRKRWNSKQNPGSIARLNMKKAYNTDKDESGELGRAKKYLKNLNKTKKRLSEMGINYDFFTPVDIPEALMAKFIKQEKDEAGEDKKKGKKEKKAESVEIDSKNVKTKNAKAATELNKTDTSTKSNKQILQEEKVPTKVNKKEKIPAKVNKQEQKDKKQKLKDAGVKPVEEFIKIQAESDDSDSSYDFDSDEYDKVLKQDSDDLTSDEGEEDTHEGDEDEDDDESDEDDGESEEEMTQKQVKGKPPIPVKQAKGKPAVVPKATQPGPSKKQAKQQEVPKKSPQEFKRKAPQKFQGSPKKGKFEKQNQKPMKKQFKKK